MYSAIRIKTFHVFLKPNIFLTELPMPLKKLPILKENPFLVFVFEPNTNKSVLAIVMLLFLFSSGLLVWGCECDALSGYKTSFVLSVVCIEGRLQSLKFSVSLWLDTVDK